MLEFNEEHAKANFKKNVLEFNQEHIKANFKKVKDMVLEFNNDHAKANLKDLDLKLKKALLMVSGVGLITIATGCSIKLDQTTIETVIENDLFNDNKDIVVGAEKVDTYEQSEAVMDVLEQAGVLLVDEPEQIEELTYDEFKETVEDATNIINGREYDINDSYAEMQEKKDYPISYTDQELTEFEKELMGDYYAIRKYIEQNQSQDYIDLYNKILSTKIHELFVEEGINNALVTDVSYNEGNATITVNIDNEEVKFKVAINSDLGKIIASMEQENYENFKDEINGLIDENLHITKLYDGSEIIRRDDKIAESVGIVGIGAVGALIVAYSISSYNNYMKNRKR